MWEPIYRREIEGGTLAASWVGPVEKSVIGLLDPPRHAIGDEGYKKAQRGIFDLYKKFQTDTKAPVPVGLQHEFWRALNKDGKKRLKDAAVDKYLARGGFGIVAAIRNATERPHIICLEDDASYLPFEQLKNQAISAMKAAAFFLRALVESYRSASHLYSPALFEFKALVNQWREKKIDFAEYLPALISRASGQGLEIPLELNLSARMTALSLGTSQASIQWETRRLKDEIKTRSLPGGIDRRAAVELFLYELMDRGSEAVEQQTQIEACQASLSLPLLPFVPDFILKQVSERINDDLGGYVGNTIRIDPDDQGRPPKGYGELISRLLDLGAILGIDVDKYPNLKRYIYTVNLQSHLQALSTNTFSQFMSDSVDQLESDLADLLVTNDVDRSLVELEPVMLFFDELTQFRIGYASEAQDVIANLNIVSVCEALNALGISLPNGWRVTALDLDSRLNVVREFNRDTIKRGKKLCKSLEQQMDSLKSTTAIFCCDGYLGGVFGSLLKSEVSYSLLVPNFL